MAKDLHKILAKLDRPPAGHNWARFVHSTTPETTRSILQFVKGQPRFNYQSAMTAIRDQFLFGIGLDQALSIVRRSGAPAGREQNENLVEAFFEYDKKRRYTPAHCIESDREWFRVSRDILVPVSPLVVIQENGRFLPIFLCGWNILALDSLQRRLLVTICEDAFLSLTDYMDSPAEFLFFPAEDNGHGADRKPEVWHRGDYQLLSTEELNDCVEIYLAAREEARAVVLAEMAAERVRKSAEPKAEQPGDETEDLFKKGPDDK